MTERVDPEAAMKMATDIVIAYLGNRSLEPSELPQLVRQVRAALVEEPPENPSEASSGPQGYSDFVRADSPLQRLPAVPVEDSVTTEYLVSLEDGKRYRSLKRHLMSKYGMTPEQYRQKWGLPSDYPMVAPSYAAERSLVAKRIGLGRAKTEKVQPPKAARRPVRAKA